MKNKQAGESGLIKKKIVRRYRKRRQEARSVRQKRGRSWPSVASGDAEGTVTEENKDGERMQGVGCLRRAQVRGGGE